MRAVLLMAASGARAVFAALPLSIASRASSRRLPGRAPCRRPSGPRRRSAPRCRDRRRPRRRSSLRSAAALCGGVAALESSERGALQAGVLRRDLECRVIVAVLEHRPHASWPVVVISSRPSLPCTTQARSSAEAGAASRPSAPAILRSIDADQLALGAGRIGQRARAD